MVSPHNVYETGRCLLPQEVSDEGGLIVIHHPLVNHLVEVAERPSAQRLHFILRSAEDGAPNGMRACEHDIALINEPAVDWVVRAYRPMAYG